MVSQRVKRTVVGAGLACVIGLSTVGSAGAVESSTWDKLAQCESSGNWGINTGNGYSGGLQFTPSTWTAYGGTGSAQNASREQQIAVAERVLKGQGWGAWPACSHKLGLRGGSAVKSVKPKTTAPVKAAVKKPTAKKTVTTPPRGGSGGVYRVKPGDTLSTIAQSRGVKGGWRALHARNAAKVADPNLIYPGQVLAL